MVRGWESDHLYAFTIGETELIDFSFGCNNYERRTVCVTRLSDVILIGNRRPRFLYEYDFGDSWIQQLIVEQQLAANREVTYPICLEGERGCPPEDCGGPWGYADFLEALADPDHEQHGDFVDWGSDFEPEEFDAAKATMAMRRSLADWMPG